MAEQSRKTKVVTLKELVPKMRIVEFMGFTSKYLNLDELTGKWIKINFKGCSVKVLRNDVLKKTSAEELQKNDTLVSISGFHSSLAKITTVTPSLIEEFGKRGFTRFRVLEEENLLAAHSRSTDRKAIIENIEHLIAKVKEAESSRKETAKSLETSMDKARNGNFDISALIGSIEKISQSDSSKALSILAMLKRSEQVYAHCVDVASIYEHVYQNLVTRKNWEPLLKNKEETMLAAMLHDFGKSQIPKHIVESLVRYENESYEMKLLRTHAENGANLLEKLELPKLLVEMTRYHHVKCDQNLITSYPKNVNYEALSKETKLLSIIDTYQSLVGKRIYKKSWNPSSAIRYIDALAGVEFDEDIWDDCYQVLGLYPISSLVVLNDQSKAFVVDVPTNLDDIEKPIISIIKNSKGNVLSKNPVINLAEQDELKIVQDADCVEEFGVNSYDLFTSLKVA